MDARKVAYDTARREGLDPAAALARAYGPGSTDDSDLLDMAMFGNMGEGRFHPVPLAQPLDPVTDAHRTNTRPLRSKRASRSKVR